MIGTFMRRLFAALVLAALTSSLAWAQGLLPIPALSARVIDQTGTLSASETAALERKLAAFEARKGSQIVLLMVPTTQPEDIASYANRIGNAWKIGRKDVGDGVLVIVAKNDRKMRIEVAKTLEGAVPDLAAARIIDEAMKPRFRENDFAGGLGAAVDQLTARISGETLPEVPANNTQKSGSDTFSASSTSANLGIFLFIVVLGASRLIRGIFGNQLGSLLTMAGTGGLAFFFTHSIVLAVIAGLFALLLSLFMRNLPVQKSRGGHWRSGSSSGGWSSGSGGGWSSGSGGGFSSGGGGDFGGGGASGDW